MDFVGINHLYTHILYAQLILRNSNFSERKWREEVRLRTFEIRICQNSSHWICKKKAYFSIKYSNNFSLYFVLENIC